MLPSISLILLVVGVIEAHSIVHAPPPGYYCYLQCLNKCLATPPQVKTDDLLEFCKTEVCWPMTPDESYCDPNRRLCFVGACKPSDVAWILDEDARTMHSPTVTGKRRTESSTMWRLQWDSVPGAQFYALYHWQDGDNSTMFNHQEVSQTWALVSTRQCRQQFARAAAVSTTGISAFSDVSKAFAFMNESDEEVTMKLTMKHASVVSMPYFYDPTSAYTPTPVNSVPEPMESSTLILTIGFELDSPGWVNEDVRDLIDYAFLPVSCPPSDSSLDLTSLKPKTVRGSNEFVLNLPGSIAQRRCKFLFSIKSILTPCGRAARVVHKDDNGANGLWATLDCEQIENAACLDDPHKIIPILAAHSAIDEPPRGQDPQEESQPDEDTSADSSMPVQPPRTNGGDILHYFDEGAAQPLAVLLAFLVALPVILFWILRCTVCKKPAPKQVMPM